MVTVVCKQLHPQRSGGSAAIAESHKVPCPLVTLKGSLSLRVGKKVIIAPVWTCTSNVEEIYFERDHLYTPWSVTKSGNLHDTFQ